MAAPGGGYKQELNQSPVLFRESAALPDQEERIRRKDAIIQTRNAQVAALWDELHTKQPWRNAVSATRPVQPFPADATGNSSLVAFIGINSVRGQGAKPWFGGMAAEPWLAGYEEEGV